MLKSRFEDLDHLVLVRGAFRQELGRAIALRADAFATIDMGSQGGMVEHLVQHRGGQFFRADRGGEAVKIGLGFHHDRAQLVGFGILQGFDGPVDDFFVDRTEQLLDVALPFSFSAIG